MRVSEVVRLKLPAPGAEELPDRQAEIVGFLVTADFFRDFYFYNLPLLFCVPSWDTFL